VDSSIPRKQFPADQYSFAVVIPTIGRVAELSVLLESLRRQTQSPQQVIIVDQNGDDRLEALLEEFQDLPIDWVRVQLRGAARARNIGKHLAEAEVLTFADDDCEFPGDLIERVNRMLQEDAQVDAISVASRDKNGGRGITRFSREPATINRYNVFRCSVEFGVFFRSACIDDLDYDETLGVGSDGPYWSDEGPDLLLRLIERGGVIRYTPELVIYHPDPVKRYDEQAITRSRRYGCGRGRFLRKHKYPIWFVLYSWVTYAGAATVSLLQLRPNRFKYYLGGLQGRLGCYFHRL
jgi:glycosyltransferase involved in cell wall biosynthesis